MNASEVRDLTDTEIEARLRDARDAVFNLRFQHASGALERTGEISQRRREIARLLTIAREREIARQQEAIGG
ncbi:MAG: 50S ribosomal protein L29 [Thermoleophilia bacterium]